MAIQTTLARAARRLWHRIEGLLVWALAHASGLWEIGFLAVIAAITYEAFGRIHPGAVTRVLHAMDRGPLTWALVLTALNIAVMGLYDVIVFRQSGVPWSDRWRFGAVAFAWSNFLTLGPLAGPAIRFWLYRRDRHTPELAAGIAAIAMAFGAGLAGWTGAAMLAGPEAPLAVTGAIALGLAWGAVLAAATIVRRCTPTAGAGMTPAVSGALAGVGWVDWWLAATVFQLAVTAAAPGAAAPLRTFFLGQAIGLASLIPGGLGSSDAFWLARLPVDHSVAAGALIAYRGIYYILPWALASLALLTWAVQRSHTRIEYARRFAGALAAAGGVLMLLSAASPALQGRLAIVSRYVPLPIVELGHLTSAVAGILLLVLARGLARGYRAALRATVLLLVIAGGASLVKGLDWEEGAIAGFLAAALAAQGGLFDRESEGTWLERRDFGIAVGALAAFLLVGAFAHQVTTRTIERWAQVGYHRQAQRFVRTASLLALATSAMGLYLVLRAPAPFRPPADRDLDRALEFLGRHGDDTTPAMAANGDKSLFFAGESFTMYRTTGPYLVVFGNPVIAPDDGGRFLDELFRFASELDRRLIFYQIAPKWLPALHDRGFAFFKLGEEALVDLSTLTADGPDGKMYRQIFRRGERDGLAFSRLAPREIRPLLPELRAVSEDWLRSKQLRERQFSIGHFTDAYLQRLPCAIVRRTSDGAIVAFANLLEQRGLPELSVDLMRYRSDAPRGVMDYLLVSVLFYGRQAGFSRFNLGMAPLAEVGRAPRAHLRERLAHLVFQHGEHWYNFQGLRSFKEKFEPEWAPRYLAYPAPLEWPAALAYVSALIAGGWTRVL